MLLTLVDKLSHKEAVTKIYSDHRHLSGFSRRNIRRNLPSDNVTVPRRIRPSWPKNSTTEDEEASKLSIIRHEQNQNGGILQSNLKEDDLRKTTRLAPATQIGEENKIMQLSTQELAKSLDDVIPPNDEAKQSGFDDINEGTTNAESKVESTITSPIKQNKDSTDTTKKVLVSSISIPFEALRRDMEAVFRTTKGMGNIFFRASFDLQTDVSKIECCGITPQKDTTMISIGKGRILEET
jgi:hypothetical protein